MHQSLHHLVADAPWNDEQMLAEVLRQVLLTMEKHGPVVAWIVDDTGFPKQGNPNSIATLRTVMARLLLAQLSLLPFLWIALRMILGVDLSLDHAG